MYTDSTLSQKVGSFSEGRCEFMTNLSPNQTSKIWNGKFRWKFLYLRRNRNPTHELFVSAEHLPGKPSRRPPSVASIFLPHIASLTPPRHSRTTQCDSSHSNFDERLGLRCRVKVTERKAFLKYLRSVLLLKPANLLKYHHQEIYSKVLIIQSK